MSLDNKKMVLRLISAFLAGVLAVTPVVAELQSPLRAPAPAPSFDNQDDFTKQCWFSAFAGSSRCLATIHASFRNDTVSSVPASCCKPITEISPSCWSKLFASNPKFSSSLKGYCNKKIVEEADVKPLRAAVFDTSGGVYLEAIGQNPDVRRCAEILTSNEECDQEFTNSLHNWRVDLLGSACCKIIMTIDDRCWPYILLWSSDFGPMATNYCKHLVGPQAPMPK